MISLQSEMKAFISSHDKNEIWVSINKDTIPENMSLNVGDYFLLDGEKVILTGVPFLTPHRPGFLVAIVKKV